MAAWKEAPEVREIAEELIPKYHLHLEPMKEQIRYVFRDKAQHSNGRTVWGKAHKITGMAAYLAVAVPDSPAMRETASGEEEIFLAPEFFLMEIAAGIWEDLSHKGRLALVDHELAHFTIDMDEMSGALVLAIKGHDIEEFHQIVARHGLWKEDLEVFNKAIQMHLDGMGPEGGEMSFVEKGEQQWPG